jgi:uncharacterized membrane protein
MKKASEIMFKIGNIFTIIYLILGGILFVIGLISSIAAGVAAAAASSDAEVAAAAAALGSAISLIFLGIYFFVTSLICLIVVRKAQRELADESKANRKPFIVTIVVGAIASNYFYVLAGIFGLIAEGQQGQKAE